MLEFQALFVETPKDRHEAALCRQEVVKLLLVPFNDDPSQARFLFLTVTGMIVRLPRQ